MFQIFVDDTCITQMRESEVVKVNIGNIGKRF